MPKIEANTAQSFKIDNVPYQKGAYELVVNGDLIGINRVGSPNIATATLFSPVIFSDYTDNLDAPIASAAAFLTYVEPFLFKP